MASLDRAHWRALKGIFKYLVGTVNVGVCYGYSGIEDGTRLIMKAQDRVAGFVDADYGGDLDTRRSTTGCLYVEWWSNIMEIKSAANDGCLLQSQSILVFQRLQSRLCG